MELQRRSCVPPNDVPAETILQQRAVLQERSANWPCDFNNTGTSTLKRSRSPSPLEHIYGRRPAPAGSYFTGNVHAQYIGLARFGVERSKKQVDSELKRLYRKLQQSDKYRKYREKQPVMTVAEIIAKEARELAEERARELAAEKAGRPVPKQKDKTVWPEFLEQAVWRVNDTIDRYTLALVRWPLMGRKKYMLNGALRGRNELIQYSIRRDTGITRDRKQVSSHLQVLKHHLHNVPTVLFYMAIPEDDKKRHRGRESSHAYHHGRERSQPQHVAAESEHDYNTSNAHLWDGARTYSSSYIQSMGHGVDDSTSPFTIQDFNMFVGVEDQPVHFFTSIARDSRLADLNITDHASWHRQYSEFDFLKSQMRDWSAEGRRILVCNASIKVMTESRPNASLTISFDLHSQRDLGAFQSVQCTTRFFDSGDMAPNPQLDGPDALDLKEHHTPCDYVPEPHGPTGLLRIKFGSKFWVSRMTKYQNLRHSDKGCVSKSLLRLTATQDIYGIKPGKRGEAECLFTILWRFQQTKYSVEVGRMRWRAVKFDSHRPAAVDQHWIKEEDHHSVTVDDLNSGQEEVLRCFNNASQEASLFQHVPHPLDFSQHPSHHVYDLQEQHTQHPLQLQLDILASLQPNLEQSHASAASSASTDYSQPSLSNVSHGHDAIGIYAPDANNFDFDGGHITISGAFEPAINLSAYDGFATQGTGLEGLHALAGLDHDGYSLGLTCADGDELVNVNDMHDADLACYSTKPNWQHANLISHLESAAEQYHAYLGHDQATHGHDVLHRLAGPSPALTQGEELVAHGLHNAGINLNGNAGIWILQSPFHEENTGGGANDGGCRTDSGVHGHEDGLGLLDLIERDQRARGY
ncbi:hypothetical protein CC86DRAFT_429180 [Ophiobolus disseminans]|uniref:TEA domain-containing protein n=1 Tax=Ophiobolus disseminans TaxID=1469910 RepID=A0A6A6ZJP0_9PLEO|nr:hypothetical protein CC86DRAFT_429180 [Ophiobolus disseminans]